jgi:hypothetical protein
LNAKRAALKLFLIFFSFFNCLWISSEQYVEHSLYDIEHVDHAIVILSGTVGVVLTTVPGGQLILGHDTTGFVGFGVGPVAFGNKMNHQKIIKLLRKLNDRNRLID